MSTEARDTELRLALQARLGASLRLGDTLWTLREVLSNPPSIVLEAEGQRDIQADRHGDSHRRVPRTRSVPLSSGVPEIRALLKLPAP